MTKTATRGAKVSGPTLRQQVLLAALDCSEGNLDNVFTAEDLLLAAWKRNPMVWGLRAHEREHPNSEMIYTELDRASVGGKNVRGGLVGLGLLEKVRQRTFRLTVKGLAEASAVVGATPGAQAKAERALGDAVATILSHPVFREWLQDSSKPKNFRDAGHFWGIAPGTPPSVIRNRVGEIDHTLTAARALLDTGNGGGAVRHGKAQFDQADIERATEFQCMLKQRFARELATLQVSLT